MNIKGNVSYYDMGGRDAEMYRAIDEHLALTKRFSPEVVMRNRRRVLTIGSVIGGIAAFIAINAQVRYHSLGGFLTGGMFAVIIFWILVHYARTYGKTPFIEMVRSDNIISADGLENVYNDLMRAKQIKDTNVYMGETYLFKKNDCLYRIKDIKEFFINMVSSDESTTYYASVRIKDESGLRVVNLRILNGLSAKRQKRFDEVTAPIKKMREAIMRNEQS